MKMMKKLFAIALVAAIVLSLGVTAMAQTVPTGATKDTTKATITITNAAKGETYKIAKLFDATVTGKTDGSIAYTGTIPETLSDYFTKDSAGNVKAVSGLDLTDKDVQTALKTWAESHVTEQAVSDGSALEFINLDYGYYIITTTQGETLLTVDSTNPNASVIDKNKTTPVSNPTKKADDTDVYIGQTVTYTVSFGTSSFDENNKQIVKYTIADTLPDYLTNVTVTSVKVIETPAKEAEGGNPDVAEVSTNLTSLGSNFATSKEIVIPWVDNNGANIYKNGSTIEIIYTAKVGTQAAIDGNGNKNKVTISYTLKDGTPKVDTQNVEETIYTYAAALQKVDENKAPLAGAKFSVKGLTVTGSAGDYLVTAYDPTSTTDGTVMECDAQGQLVIRGLATDTPLTLTETAAPKGYNKLTTTETLTAVKTGEAVTKSSQTIYYDANGKVTNEVTTTSFTKETYNVNLLKNAIVVVNQKGTEMPSTGGIGTKIFYGVGAVLVIGAGVVLMGRKRAAD